MTEYDISRGQAKTAYARSVAHIQMAVGCEGW